MAADHKVNTLSGLDGFEPKMGGSKYTDVDLEKNSRLTYRITCSINNLLPSSWLMCPVIGLHLFPNYISSRS